jgi:hypothetical protein
MIPSRRRSCRRAIQTKCDRLRSGLNNGNSPTIVDLSKESLLYGQIPPRRLGVAASSFASLRRMRKQQIKSLLNSRMVGNPSVTRPNGQRRVRCGLPVIQALRLHFSNPFSQRRLNHRSPSHRDDADVVVLAEVLSDLCNGFSWLFADRLGALETEDLAVFATRFDAEKGDSGSNARPFDVLSVCAKSPRKLRSFRDTVAHCPESSPGNYAIWACFHSEICEEKSHGS